MWTNSTELASFFASASRSSSGKDDWESRIARKLLGFIRPRGTSKMNLKSMRLREPGFETFITPQHFSNPKVSGSTSASVRARFRTSLVVWLMFAAGFDTIVSMRTSSCVSFSEMMLDTKTEEFESGLGTRSISSASIQIGP